MSSRFLLSALVAAAPAWAQSVPTVTITGNPWRSADPASPSTVLSGDALALRRGSTLGDTLDGVPGVSASAFGPNASRPVIRGQDGDRIRVLNNAGASLDASSLSYDHAVPLDPLVIERLEVLRGPAALLYGGGAIGGVVNAMDNRIPRQPLTDLSGAAELRLGGAASERAVSGLVEGGAGALTWHADAFRRATSDLSVPAFDRPLEAGGSERRTRVVNSASQAAGGALGVSHATSHGHVGVSVDTYRNDYGVVVEDDVTIRMRRDRLALAGEETQLPGAFSTLRAQAAVTDYEHQEVEGDGAVGTVFRTRGTDARLEAVQRRVSWAGLQWDGVVGAQAESSRFSALGEEAFVPSTRTQQVAAFVLQRLDWGSVELSGGLRAEQVRVRSEGDAAADTPRFGPAAQRRFQPLSAALNASWRLVPDWTLSASLAHTERAPTSYELFADGVHAATATYERGNTEQALERGRNFDLGLAWQQGPDQLKLNAFVSQFDRYIALLATGESVTEDDGTVVPVHAFQGVPARLWGLELQGRKRLWSKAGNTLTLEASLDSVRGVQRDSGEALPRLAPLRGQVALQWQQGAWQWGASLQAAARQERVPTGDEVTPGWVQAHLSAQWQGQWGAQPVMVFAKLRNLGDTLAYNATSIATVRALSPAEGRSLAVGARLSF